MVEQEKNKILNDNKGLSTKGVVKYLVMPGILPRVKKIVETSFSYFAFLLALTYSALRLIPENHAFANPANMGRYGIGHVVAEAANNIVVDKRNTDKIILFFATLIGIALLFLQFVALVLTVFSSDAWAGTTVEQINALFITTQPEKDIAFSILDQVFAVPGIFGSKYAPASQSEIPLINAGLHKMYQMYSYAILFVGVIVFLYYMLVVAFETAQTGVPFGRRFDNVWVPLRLVAAIGLLLPINYGLNSAQFITLYVAKMGSSMATNIWLKYNESIQENQPGMSPFGVAGKTRDITFYRGTDAKVTVTDEMASAAALLAVPEIPDVSTTTKFGFIVATCMALYDDIPDKNVDAYFVNGRQSRLASEVMTGDVAAWEEFVKTFFQGQDVIMRIGNLGNTEQHQHYRTRVIPYCGEWRFPVANFGRALMRRDAERSPSFIIHQSMASTAYNFYSSWGDAEFSFPRDFGRYMATAYTEKPDVDCYVAGLEQALSRARNGADFMGNTGLRQSLSNVHTDISADNCQFPAQGILQGNALMDNYFNIFAVKFAYETYLQSIDASLTDKIREMGWGGAGVWYNSIAEMNGNFVSSIYARPTISKMPLIMQQVAEFRRRHNAATTPEDMYNVVIASDPNLEPNFDEAGNDMEIAKVLGKVYKYTALSHAERQTTRTSPFMSIINSILGTSGIISMRENPQVHPLAQLSTLGKSMLDAAVRNLMLSFALATGGGVLGAAGVNSAAGVIQGISTFISSLVVVALSSGIILYYIVPFLPFMYFFFGVGTWIMAIFEAMVGVPLWALAHLRLEGKGFMGDSAVNGYLLLLEIFIRPTLMVFGLLATSIIFFAEVAILNSIWDLAVCNLGGYGCSDSTTPDDLMSIEYWRDPIDQFFFSVMYVIVVYMAAMGTFKLIDAVPDNIIRWIGGNVQTFSDNQSDPTEGLVRNAGISSAMIGQQVAGAIPTIGSTAGRVVASPFVRNLAGGETPNAGRVGSSSTPS